MTLLRHVAIFVSTLFAMSPAFAASVGQPAPAFSVVDSAGKTHALADYKGKIVVLEWSNPECPFVKKHYSSGNIPKQQTEATGAGVIWLTVNSAGVGKEGHVDGMAADAFVASYHAKPTAYLIDTDGKVGRAYGAKTTPHLFVIDDKGVLRYDGGIDSIASTDKDDLAKATQYVPQVIGEIKSGKAVSVSTSEPYGCSVKYGS
ncbi:MAG: redoxin domain-containing protein [Rudaea sp.]